MGGWHATTTAPAADQLVLFGTLPLGREATSGAPVGRAAR